MNSLYEIFIPLKTVKLEVMADGMDDASGHVEAWLMENLPDFRDLMKDGCYRVYDMDTGQSKEYCIGND